MKYDLAPFEALVKEGYLRKSETDDLVLYGYTDACTFDRHWNEYTSIARGLILEKSTGTMVAKCFPKFFNLGERDETMLQNLPAEEGYTVSEKLDGSLGIIFNYKGKWTVATRGSFFSEQAVKAQEMLKNYNLADILEDTTILVEIIYPENKIVVNYGQEEKLVILGSYDRKHGVEHGRFFNVLTATQTGMELAESYEYTINQMLKLQKTLPKDQEGFVVRFNNGLRIKIKGDEYSKIHKMISNMSPISFWESMADGQVNKDYIAQLPEEFRKDFEPMVAALEADYFQIMKEIGEDLGKLPSVDVSTREGKKQIGLFVQGSNGLKHPIAMFPVLLQKMDAVEGYIMKQIRPNGNVLSAVREAV